MNNFCLESEESFYKGLANRQQGHSENTLKSSGRLKNQLKNMKRFLTFYSNFPYTQVTFAFCFLEVSCTFHDRIVAFLRFLFQKDYDTSHKPFYFFVTCLCFFCIVSFYIYILGKIQNYPFNYFRYTFQKYLRIIIFKIVN